MPRWLFALLLLCVPSVLNAQWHEARSEHFILYGDGSEEELRQTAAELESFDRLLRRLMDVKDHSGSRLRIFLMPDRAAVVGTTDGSDPQLAGYYTDDPDAPILVAPRTDTGNGRFDIAARDVLFHEYAHHIMLQYSEGPQPVWYAEGLAEYYSTAQVLGGGGFEIGAAPANRVAVLREAQDWIPLGELLAASDYRQFSGRLHLLYAQGWLLAHYVTQNAERRDELETYFRLVSEGKTRGAAVDAAFGPGASDFDRQLRGYAARQAFASQRLDLPPVDRTAVAMRPLRPAEADLIGFDIALRRGLGSTRPASFLNALDTAGRPHLDDPYARHLIAMAERRIGGQAAVAFANRSGSAGPAAGGR